MHLVARLACASFVLLAACNSDDDAPNAPAPSAPATPPPTSKPTTPAPAGASTASPVSSSPTASDPATTPAATPTAPATTPVVPPYVIPASLLDGKMHTDLDDPAAAEYCSKRESSVKRATWTSTGMTGMDWVFDMAVQDSAFEYKAPDGTVTHSRGLSLVMKSAPKKTIDPTNGPTRSDTTSSLPLAHVSSTAAAPPAFEPFTQEKADLCDVGMEMTCNRAGAQGGGAACAVSSASPGPTGKVVVTAIKDGFVDGTITWDQQTGKQLTFHAPLETIGGQQPFVCCLQ